MTCAEIFVSLCIANFKWTGIRCLDSGQGVKKTLFRHY